MYGVIPNGSTTSVSVSNWNTITIPEAATNVTMNTDSSMLNHTIYCDVYSADNQLLTTYSHRYLSSSDSHIFNLSGLFPTGCRFTVRSSEDLIISSATYTKAIFVKMSDSSL